MEKRILVTSALPYANGSLHIGHFVEYVETDIFVRFLRLLGKDVVYCCADDTHGTPIELKARDQKITPEELIAKYHEEHTKDFKDFLISFDNYYSTNTPENKYYSDLIFNRLQEKGFIYKKVILQTYCEKCERFLPDRYVKGKCPKCNAEDQYGDVCEKCDTTYKTIDILNPRCAICKTPAVQKESTHYLFKLSALSKQLSEWIKNKKFQSEITNYIQNWIKEGLEDWDISRDGPYFGFKIPGEENKYYYVWLDAPIGYIASTANYCEKNKLKVEDYWQNKDSQIIHFIGKDIIYFHFLFWPAMLIVSGFNLPSNIFVHGFLTVNGEKMSKSRGTFFTAREFLDKYKNPEYLRFYYGSLLSSKLADINLDFDNFRERVNAELIGNFGNFAYRTLSIINKNFDGKIPEGKIDKNLEKKVSTILEKIKIDSEKINLSELLKNVMALSHEGNQYLQEKEPWKNPKTAPETLYNCANLLVLIAGLIKPYIPAAIEKLEGQLNFKIENGFLKEIKLENLKPGHKINKPEILFQKIEDDKIKSI